MTTMLSRLVMCTLALLFLGLGPASAASDYPFTRQGVVDFIDLNSRTMVVNDAEYKFPATLLVFYFHGKTPQTPEERQPQVGSPVSTLRKGVRIGFNVEGEGPGRKGTIVAAWVLLPGSVKESRE